MTLLEVCIDSAAGLDAARNGGADRVELCAALELGGLTPSTGLVALAREMGIPARAMIRPRAGDFVFSADEVSQMHAEIAAMRAIGIEGVVLGASLADGRLDRAVLADLVAASSGLACTLHRAFDLVPDLEEAVETAVELGFDTILTSGRAASAQAGLADIAKAHRLAHNRITIMAGSGVNEDNVGILLAAASLGAVHASCSAPAKTDSASATRLGFVSAARRVTEAGRVVALRQALQDLERNADVL